MVEATGRLGKDHDAAEDGLASLLSRLRGLPPSGG